MIEMTAPAVVPRPAERRLRMSYEQFLAWSDEDTHAEWVNGEVIVFMPPVTHHQEIVGFLHWLVSAFASLFDLGRVFTAPFEMRHLPGYASREPDLLFVSREHLHRLTPERLDGPADLVVEVVSPSSAKRDRQEKRDEYERAAVREYWAIDPRPGYQQALCYTLGPDECYAAILPDAEGRYHSVVLPGFWFREAWLFATPHPDPLMTLAEIRGLSPEAAQTLRDAFTSSSSS
ncbi:MAG: Uma2 family endonuclease [Chloroflexaceae bacterium]|nr:Uma2 family endonuclease [Chloroflexaceae bacterium]